jgi:ABC-type phosphate transport system substrate-binding protein
MKSTGKVGVRASGMACMRTTALGGMIFAVLAAKVHAEHIVVIVNPAAKPPSKEQIVDIYLGRRVELTPLDQTVGSPIYIQFYKKATGRDVAQIKAIWSRVMFAGKGRPPRQLPDSAAVKKIVASNPYAVGYIEKSAVDATVKVALPVD